MIGLVPFLGLSLGLGGAMDLTVMDLELMATARRRECEKRGGVMEGRNEEEGSLVLTGR